MSKREDISRFIPEYSGIEKEAAGDDLDDSWYLSLSHVFLLIMNHGPSDSDLLQRVSDFIEWALTQDEALATAATIELLEPLLYGQYGPVGPLLESKLGKAASGFLTRTRASL